jgi:hypothetical protein
MSLFVCTVCLLWTQDLSAAPLFKVEILQGSSRTLATCSKVAVAA